MKKIIAILLFTLFTNSLSAQTLVVHLNSYHNYNIFNNRNYGIGYITESNFLFGYYRNSINSPSFYFGKNWQVTESLSIPIILATGYNDTKLKLILLPTLNINIYGKTNIGLGFAPTYYDNINKFGFIIHSTLQFKF